MSLPLTLRQKSRLKNLFLLLVGGYLFVTWNRQGAQTYVENGYDGVLQEESSNFGEGFHEVCINLSTVPLLPYILTLFCVFSLVIIYFHILLSS